MMESTVPCGGPVWYLSLYCLRWCWVDHGVDDVFTARSSPSGACTRDSLSATTWASPGVWIASGGNDSSTSRSASPLAIIASFGLDGRIFTNMVSAPTLSHRTFNTIRDCAQWSDQMSTATRTAKLSLTVCSAGWDAEDSRVVVGQGA